jgi:hypothetical protein
LPLSVWLCADPRQNVATLVMDFDDESRLWGIDVRGVSKLLRPAAIPRPQPGELSGAACVLHRGHKWVHLTRANLG